MTTIHGLVILGIVAGVGCGGDVVVDGPPEDSDTTTSVGTGPAQCTIGACGDSCVACNDIECLPGVCSAAGECLFSVECPID